MGELAALAVSFFWALTPVISTRPVAEVGAVRFSRIRYFFAAFLLAAIVFATGRPLLEISPQQLSFIALSSFGGVVLGEIAMFQAISMVGPRITSLLYALNAPIAVILAYVILDERIGLQGLLGITIAFAGVVLILLSRRDRTMDHTIGARTVFVGILFGFASAVLQASGIILIKPVLEGGADAVATSFLRVSFAAAFMLALATVTGRLRDYIVPKATAARIATSAATGTGLGTTLMIVALSLSDVAIASALAALSPVMILPILLFLKHERPSLRAWVGAAITVLGVAMILAR
ncbi:MAG: DMT family transporter [Nitratireductor sp.]